MLSNTLAYYQRFVREFILEREIALARFHGIAFLALVLTQLRRTAFIDLALARLLRIAFLSLE